MLTVKGIGDPTEYALLETFRKIGYDENDIRKSIERVEEVPFDSDKKNDEYKVQNAWC